MSNGSGLFGGQGPMKPHLVRGGGGIAGEISDLRSDVGGTLSSMAATTVDEFIDPALADVDAIRLAAATVAALRTLSGADLDGVVGAGEMVPPRNLTVTTAGATPADAPATVTVRGKVRNGSGKLVAQEEIFTVSQIAGAAVGLLAFSVVEEIEEAAADGVAATLAYGFGDVIGLGQPLRSRAGVPAVMMEIEAGVVFAADAVTGAFTDAATAAPNGTYLPATVPDGANDYAIYYEYDPQA